MVASKVTLIPFLCKLCHNEHSGEVVTHKKDTRKESCDEKRNSDKWKHKKMGGPKGETQIPSLSHFVFLFVTQVMRLDVIRAKGVANE